VFSDDTGRADRPFPNGVGGSGTEGTKAGMEVVDRADRQRHRGERRAVEPQHAARHRHPTPITGEAVTVPWIEQAWNWGTTSG
jgi:hypothetical protein